MGPSAFFGYNDFEVLAGMGGERGAKALLATNEGPVPSIDFALGAIELDTPADYLALLNTLEPTR